MYKSLVRSKLDFVHLGGVGEDVCELSVNCGWGFSAVGFQPRQCNISVGQPQHEVRRFRYVSNFCTKSSQFCSAWWAYVAIAMWSIKHYSETVRQVATPRGKWQQ